MANIRDLFGIEGLEEAGDGIEIEPSSLSEQIDLVMREKYGTPAGQTPEGDLDPATGSAPPAGEGDNTQDPPEGTQVPAPAAAAPAPPVDPGATPVVELPQVTPAADPFVGLTETERAELILTQQALRDPERAQAVRQAMMGVAPTAAAPPAPVTPPEPPKFELPEDVDPDTVEARLLQENWEIRQQLAEQAQARQTQDERTQQAQLHEAAVKASQAFSAKYGSTLSEAEMQAVAITAGTRKLPDALIATGQAPEEAMTNALEFVLRQDDALLAKVLGAPAAPVAPGLTPQSQERKRTLHALSSAASPTGAPATRTPISHRPGDSKLTEGSRMSLMQELMNGMRAEREGIS